LQTLTEFRAIGRAALPWLVTLLWLPAATGLAAAHEHADPVVLAPGYADLEFTPPAPGSYRLPPLGAAPDGQVLDSQGRSLSLHDLMGEGPVLLSFIYTSCSDVNGCPLATHVLAKTTAVLAQDRQLAGQVRLLSLSFDPDHDTPEVMRRYGAPFRDRGLDWRFLTTRSEDELGPILEGYDQWVVRDQDAEGNPISSFSHLLRVFLIDRDKRIRNIYSVSFLHADTLSNDIRTITMEHSDSQAP
jgi:cytochrome c peroxidase